MKKIYSFVSLFLTIVVFSQDYTFTVLANKGENMVKKGTQWSAIKAGEKIYQNNTIKVVDNGYLGMMHRTGKTVEVKSKGEYTISQLEGNLKTKNTSYTEKYAKYVFNEVEDAPSKKYEYNVVAAVERPSVSEPLFLTKDTITIIKNIPLYIAVDSLAENHKYELHIVNLLDEVIYKNKFNRVITSIDLKDVPTEPNMRYFIKVYDLETKKYLTDIKVKQLDIIADSKSTKIIKEFENLNRHIDHKNPIDVLLLAGFFLDNNLDSYASGFMLRASTMSDEELLKKIYYNYLEKIDVVKKSNE